MNENPSQPEPRNRLRAEPSPYLRQHADNPVAWLPWGEEAFDRAQAEDKPVFLSIGYSTCHWCHVMAEESFEDEGVAALLNRDFVSIKVDREERPDIDGFYMSACQAMTGAGGWPLTIIMTPDKKPFFAGTYIPKEAKFGQNGLMELLPKVAAMWRDRRADIEHSGTEMVNLLRARAGPRTGEEPAPAVLDLAFRQLADSYDTVNGGFGPAPKFPTVHNLTFLLRYQARTGSATALSMVEQTLRKMRLGGIYDHLGGGFHRYSTDDEWLVPHFEKMLYDQAQLAIAYLEAYQATGRAEYGRTAREIFAYVARDMTDPGGGFYSAEDADSEGEEGKYYVWDRADLEAALDAEDAAFAQNVFNAGRDIGNIPHLRKTEAEIAADLGLDDEALRERLAAVGTQLFAARQMRVRPGRDDKVLTDWNGLMIAAFALGARALNEPAYARQAAAAAKFIDARLTDGSGRLLHRWRAGEAGVPAYLDDYAFMIWGLLELYETTYDPDYLGRALDLNDRMRADFWDEDEGGFFHTAAAGETLFLRRKEFYDGAIPAGNSVAALGLTRLARLTGRADLEEQARRLLAASASAVTETPIAYTHLLGAVDWLTGDSRELVIVGDRGADDTRRLVSAARAGYRPNTVILLRDVAEPTPVIDRYADFGREMSTIDGRAAAYLCRRQACGRPMTDPDVLKDALSGDVSAAG